MNVLSDIIRLLVISELENKKLKASTMDNIIFAEYKIPQHIVAASIIILDQLATPIGMYFLLNSSGVTKVGTIA